MSERELSLLEKLVRRVILTPDECGEMVAFIKGLQSRLGAALNRAEIAEARLRNVIGWRENDWPEGFDRRTAELVAELASPPAETVAARRSGAAK